MLKIKIFKEKGDDVVLARIAIVEDDVYMREELENLLKKNGYEVFSILDFENVISCIISYSPDFVGVYDTCAFPPENETVLFKTTTSLLLDL